MTADPIQKKHYEHRRWYVYVVALELVVIVTAAEAAYSYHEGLADVLNFVSAIVVTGGILAWCIYDSLARGFRLSYGNKWRIALLAVVFVPVYFWESRGAKKSAKSLFGLSLYAPFCAAYYGAWYLTVEILTRIGYFSPG